MNDLFKHLSVPCPLKRAGLVNYTGISGVADDQQVHECVTYIFLLLPEVQREVNSVENARLYRPELILHPDT